MAGISLGWGLNVGSWAVYTVGTWVRFKNLPTSPTAICDFDAGAAGQATLGYWADGQFMVDLHENGTRQYLSLCPHLTVGTNQWWWLSMMWGRGGSGGGTLGIGGQAWSNTGDTDGPQQNVTIPTPTGGPADTSFGWGVALRGGYSDMAYEQGTDLASCLLVKTRDNNFNMTWIMTPPTGAPAVDANTVGLWLPAEALGARDTIHDASSNHYDLSRGPQGCYVVRDSPYV